MGAHEIAETTSEYLRALPATVMVNGATITIAQPGRTLTIEAINDDTFLIGPAPSRGGCQTQVTDTLRVRVNLAELIKRANAWVRA